MEIQSFAVYAGWAEFDHVETPYCAIWPSGLFCRVLVFDADKGEYNIVLNFEGLVCECGSR
jgi:hypothetical protein